jgi:hypothetical protein
MDVRVGVRQREEGFYAGRLRIRKKAGKRLLFLKKKKQKNFYPFGFGLGRGSAV